MNKLSRAALNLTMLAYLKLKFFLTSRFSQMCQKLADLMLTLMWS